MATLKSAANAVRSAARSTVSKVSTAARSTTSGARSAVKSSASAAKSAVKSTTSKTSGSTSSLSSSLKSVGSAVKSTASKAASAVKSTSTRSSSSSGLTSSLKSVGSAVKTTASKAASTIKSTSTRSSSSSGLTSSLKSVGSAVKSNISNAASTVKNTATKSSGSSSGLNSSLKNIGSTAKSSVSNLTSAIKSSSLSSSKIGTALKSTIGNGTSTIKSLANKITSTSIVKPSNLKNSFNTITDSFKNNNILSSINSAVRERKVGGIGILTNLVNKYVGNRTTGSNSFKTIRDNITEKTSSITNGLLTSLNSVFSDRSKINVSNAINTLRNSLSTRTNSLLSNLFSQTGSLRANLISSIKPLNVFSGLKDKINSVKSDLKNAAMGITSIDTMGVLGLSTTLGGAAERIHTSFETWKGKISNLVNSGSMSGIVTDSIGEAKTRMEELFENFRGYAKQMANRLFGIGEDTEYLDDGYYAPEAEEGSNVLGARDYGNEYDGPSVLGAFDDLDAIEDGPGVAGASVDLGQENADLVQKAKDVWNGKYGTGQARKDALGEDYDAVQDIVNDYIKTGKWPSSGSDNNKPAKQESTPSSSSSQNSGSIKRPSNTTVTKNSDGGTTEKVTGYDVASNSLSCVKGTKKMAGDIWGTDKFKIGDENSVVYAKDMPSTYAKNKDYNVSSEPSPGAIIVFQPEHNFCTGDGKTAGHAGVVKSVTYDDKGNVESIVINHTNSSSGNQTVTLYPNNDHGSTLNYSTNNTQFITPK